MSVTRLNKLDSGDTYDIEQKSATSDVITPKVIRTLLLSLVSQHRTECNISDTLDVLHACVELGIDDDSSLVVDFDSDLLEVESSGEWSPSNGNENNISNNL